MKKFLLTAICLLLLTACSGSYLKNINLETLENKVKNKETFVLYLTKGDELGNTLKNNLETVSKNNKLETFYINTEDLKLSEQKELKEYFTYEESNIIIFVNKGQENTVLSRIDNTYITTKDLEEELKVQGFLK